MLHPWSRSELLIGSEALAKLRSSKVAVFGVGGVGSFTTEALARSGVGHFLLVDNDTVNITNINRQLVALHSTIGRPKVEIMKERIHEINPNAQVDILQRFYLPEVADEILCDDLDYIVDAIDTVTAKIDLVVQAKQREIPIISVMGAGNKLDPSRFEVADIYKTSYCPLAKVMRYELKRRDIRNLKVVYSKEEPIRQHYETGENQVPGSMSFVPPVAGMIAASEVVKDLVRDLVKR